MDSPFPFGFPGPTIFYFVLFTLTWAIHTALVDYVLAGAGWLVYTSASGRSNSVEKEGRAAMLLRDWLPLMLSAAITVGVAPLLFIQILFQREFYSAQVLLWIQWTLVGPALILGFYLLYVHKERLLCERATWLQTLNAVVCAACFAFPAICWTANFIMSVNPSLWPKYYTGEAAVFATFAYALRLGSWFAAALPTWATIIALQSWADGADEPDQKHRFDDAGERRQLSAVALGGLIAATLLGAAYIVLLEGSVRGRIFGAMGGPWLLLGAIGVGLEGFAWFKLRQSDGWNRLGLTLASVGAVCTLLGAAGVRETIRWASLAADPQINLQVLYDQHRDSFGLQGQPLFFTFVAINLGLGIYCVWLVRRANRVEPRHDEPPAGVAHAETAGESHGGAPALEGAAGDDE